MRRGESTSFRHKLWALSGVVVVGGGLALTGCSEDDSGGERSMPAPVVGEVVDLDWFPVSDLHPSHPGYIARSEVCEKGVEVEGDPTVADLGQEHWRKAAVLNVAATAIDGYVRQGLVFAAGTHVEVGLLPDGQKLDPHPTDPSQRAARVRVGPGDVCLAAVGIGAGEPGSADIDVLPTEAAVTTTDDRDWETVAVY